MFLSLFIMGMTVSFAIDTDPKFYRLTKQLCFSTVIVFAMILYSHGRAML